MPRRPSTSPGPHPQGGPRSRHAALPNGDRSQPLRTVDSRPGPRLPAELPIAAQLGSTQGMTQAVVFAQVRRRTRGSPERQRRSLEGSHARQGVFLAQRVGRSAASRRHNLPPSSRRRALGRRWRDERWERPHPLEKMISRVRNRNAVLLGERLSDCVHTRNQTSHPSRQARALGGERGVSERQCLKARQIRPGLPHDARRQTRCRQGPARSDPLRQERREPRRLDEQCPRQLHVAPGRIARCRQRRCRSDEHNPDDTHAKHPSIVVEPPECSVDRP